MVSPHPNLEKKIRNTENLIKQNKRHLIKDHKKNYPDNFISENEYDTYNTIKPHIESVKPKKLRQIQNQNQTTHQTQHQSLQSPQIHDKILVLCVDFIDKPAQIPISNIYNKFFTDIPIDYFANPTISSFKTYYKENSYNTFIPEGEVHGWYRAPQPYTYYTNNNYGYGNYPNNSQKLFEDIINIASSDINLNFSSLDIDNDSIIDYVMIIHAGDDAASTGNVNDIWSHAWETSPFLINGFGFKYYATTSEYIYDSYYGLDYRKIGIDAHEFGHLLGLPDLYDYSGNSYGAGDYSLMAYGTWSSNGYIPTHLDAWSKFKLGWSNTIIYDPSQSNTNITIDNAEINNTNHLFKSKNSNEYFILENRQHISFDYLLSANGILIWKINELKTYNDNEICYKVGLLQADGQKHLENKINLGDQGDSFPGSYNIRSFNSTTNPNTQLCDGTYSNLSIINISDSSNTMTFDAIISCNQNNQPICTLVIL